MNFLANVQDAFLRDAWAERIGWTLVHSLWQIALLAGLYAALMLALRKRSAAARYVVGCGTLLAMLIVPVGTYLLSPHQASRVVAQAKTARHAAVESHAAPAQNPPREQLHRVDPELVETVTAPESEVSPAAATGPAAAPSVARSRLSLSDTVLRPCLPWVTAAWLAGVLLLSLRPVLGWLHVLRLQRRGLSALPESLQAMGQRLCRRLGVPGAVRFAQSALVEVPAVVGYLRPLVLLPASVVSGLSPSELEMILAHELAHVRRHDYVVNLVQTVIEALLFYHPGMWWVSGQIRREREYCCDDLAVALGGSPVSYAQMLARLAVQCSAPHATVLAATGGPLVSRVRRLLGKPQAEISHRNVAGWLASLLIVSLVVVILATGGVPARVLAESPPPPAELGELSEEISSRVVRLIDSYHLSFVTEEGLRQVGAEFAELVETHQGDKLSDERKRAIVAALDAEGAMQFGLERFRPDDPLSLNRNYFEWPDRLKTMQWKLFLALTRGSLSAEEAQRRESQRQWMRDHVNRLPEDRLVKRQSVQERLEANFNDPWCTVLDRPMTADQFGLFQTSLEAFPAEAELRYVNSHIVSAAMQAMHREPGNFRLPFDDQVIRWGSSNDIVELGFKSNALFRGDSLALGDGYTVVDATSGDLVTAPPAQRDREKFAAWLDNHGKGDFAFTSSGVDGATLVGVRGATLLTLDVENWMQADAISNETLRGLLAQEGTDKIALQTYYDAHRERAKAEPAARFSGPYVGVLTREGRLAVVHVEDFSGEEIIYRARPRASDAATGEVVPDEPVPVQALRPNWKPADEARRLVIKGKIAKGHDYVLRIEGDKEPREWRSVGGDYEGPYEVLIESSDQIRQEGGKTGHGLVVSFSLFTSGKVASQATFYLAGKFAVRRKAEFVTKDDVLTVADLLLDDGQKRPVTLRMEPFSKRKPLD